MTTWTCDCGNTNTGDTCVKDGCGKPRPVALSEEERDALEAHNDVRKTIGFHPIAEDAWMRLSQIRKELTLFFRAARRPLVEQMREAEEKYAREMAELREKVEREVYRSSYTEHELEKAQKRIAELEGQGKPSAPEEKTTAARVEAAYGHEELMRKWEAYTSGRLEVADLDAVLSSVVSAIGEIRQQVALVKDDNKKNEQKPSAPDADAGEITTENLDKCWQYRLVRNRLESFPNTKGEYMATESVYYCARADIRANLARAEERHQREKDELRAEVERLTRELAAARATEEAKKERLRELHSQPIKRGPQVGETVWAYFLCPSGAEPRASKVGGREGASFWFDGYTSEHGHRDADEGFTWWRYDPRKDGAK